LNEPGAACADRDAQRHFAGAGGGLRGHQIGEIGAGDQQNHGD
jgi:hypothetical protein